MITRDEAARRREMRAAGMTYRQIADALGGRVTKNSIKSWFLRNVGPSKSRAMAESDIAIILALHDEGKTSVQIAVALGAPAGIGWRDPQAQRVKDWLKRRRDATTRPSRPPSASTRTCRICDAPVTRLGNSTCGEQACIIAANGRPASSEGGAWPSRNGKEPRGFGAHNLHFAKSAGPRLDRPAPNVTLGGVGSMWMAGR